MAQMNISNTLFNDTSEGIIAFAEQLKQDLINWNEYPHVIEELGQNRPNLQNNLNALFLSVYEKFLTFLNDADATSSAINTWKEIERFLADYTDEGTLKDIVDQLNANIESRLSVVLENTTGSSTTNGMSQKAITDALGTKQDTVQDLDAIRSGAVFDLSAYNNNTPYADLSAALTAMNSLPSTYKKGGMSIKFVRSSDNKYVQFRLMTTSFSTNEEDWQGVDDEPTAGSDNLVKSGGVNAAVKNASINIAGFEEVKATLDIEYRKPIAINLLKPGKRYVIEFKQYDASLCPSNKSCFSIYYGNTVSSYIIFGGSDLSGTSIDVSIPNDADTVYMYGRANGASILNVAEQNENLSLFNLDKKIDELKDSGYLYVGIATPSYNPSVSNKKVFYIAKTAGTYTNFGSLVVDYEGLTILKYNGTNWSRDKIIETDSVPFTLSDRLIKSKGVGLYDIHEKNIINGAVINTGFITSENAMNPNRGSGICIAINSGDIVNFYATNTSYYAWLKKNCYFDELEFCENCTRVLVLAGAVSITAPQDAKWLYICNSTTTATDLLPKSIFINGEYYDYRRSLLDNLNSRINDDIIGKTVLNQTLSPSENSTVFGKNVLKAGNSYRIILRTYNATEVNPKKFAFAVYADNTMVTVTLQLGGTDLSGTVIDVTIPANAILTDLRGRANGNVTIDIINTTILTLYALDDYINSLTQEVERNSKDINGYNLLTYEPIFIKSDFRVRSLSGDYSYVTPVKQGDIIYLKAKVNNYNFFCLLKEAPVIEQTVVFMTGETERRLYLTSGTTVEVPEDGYLVVTDTTNDYPDVHIVDAFTINDVDYSELRVKGLKERVEDLEHGQSVVTDNELSNTSTNPVQNRTLTPHIQNNKMMSDHDMFGLESDWWIQDKYLEDTYASNEATALNAFVSKFRARAGEGKYQIAIISDTHGSGAYMWKSILRNSPQSCYRSIAVLNKIAQYCDAAIHGGDLSCDYGTSRLRDLQYMYDVVRKFCFVKPFFITKGNHDENNNVYVEADMLNLDWNNNTYYVRNMSNFNSVDEDAWDGSPLFINKTELVSDREFRNIVQHWLSPSGAVWGNGAYYYYDIDSVNLRIIVANSFPVNDNHVISEDEEYLWLAQNALNLSAKATPSDWKVLMLRHTQSTSITNLTDCINAFRNGNSWTYKKTTVDFGTMNGSGITFIAHIHGHEHNNCFSNGAGYLDIGENSAFVSITSLGDASTYGLSVWTIDTINDKVYEDTIGGQTWVYNYNTNKLEIAVGEKILMAESGLARPVVASSSDTTKATCNDKVVTAVSAGDVTITMTGNNGNTYEYPITVVAAS